MCVVSVFQRCFQCWSFDGHIFWIFSPWRHFLKFYVLKVLFDTKSSSPAQNLNVSKSGICSIFELFNKIQRKSFAKRFTHKTEYLKISLSQMCQTAPFDRRQLTLFWSVGKFQKYFCKIMHAIDVPSSLVVRSAEYVDFTGSHVAFLLMLFAERETLFRPLLWAFMVDMQCSLVSASIFDFLRGEKMKWNERRERNEVGEEVNERKEEKEKRKGLYRRKWR